MLLLCKEGETVLTLISKSTVFSSPFTLNETNTHVMAMNYQNSFTLSNPDLSALNFNLPEDSSLSHQLGEDLIGFHHKEYDTSANPESSCYSLFSSEDTNDESPRSTSSFESHRDYCQVDDVEHMLHGLRLDQFQSDDIARNRCNGTINDAYETPAQHYAPFGGDLYHNASEDDKSLLWSNSVPQTLPPHWTQSSKSQSRAAHSTFTSCVMSPTPIPFDHQHAREHSPTIRGNVGHVHFTNTTPTPEYKCATNQPAGPHLSPGSPNVTLTYAYTHQGGVALLPVPLTHVQQPQIAHQPYVVLLPTYPGYGQGKSVIPLHQAAGEPSGPARRAPFPAPTKVDALKTSGVPEEMAKQAIYTPNKLSEQDIYGNVFRLSRDQVGCRLLQQKLDEGDPAIVGAIFDESKKHLAEMMLDPFGNYLFQKLFEKANSSQCSGMLEIVKGSLVRAALNIHGTRSVQKVLETCTSNAQIATIQGSLEPRIVELCLDANGNHVIQKAVQCMSDKDKDFVFRAVIAACTTVACHRHGCCVIQRCLDAASREQQWGLINAIVTCALELMQDPYGNYVVQYVLDLGRQTEAWAVAEKCLGHVALLSTQKFSSNVMEKCLEKANEQLLAAIVNELCDPRSLQSLLQDQYANYVIQRALTVSPVDVASRLVVSIKPHLSLLRNTSGGRRIVSKILKRFPKTDIGGDFLGGLT